MSSRASRACRSSPATTSAGTRIDPVPGPHRIGRAFWSSVLLAVMPLPLALGVQDPQVALLSAPLAIASLCLLTLYFLVRARRRHRYDARHGFPPWAGRTDPAPSNRTVLYRVGVDRLLSDLCLMLDRWEYVGGRWQHADTLEQVWINADDPARLGSERARLGQQAESLEDAADDERLADERDYALAETRIQDLALENQQARSLGRDIVQDPR